MVKKVSEYMQKYHMLEEGDTVIVGVSGGADSVCLLSVLSNLRETMQLSLVAGHVNHMYRKTAKRDEKYVEDLCRKWDIPCKILRVDVSAVAEERGMSFEEAGRMVRYEFFEQLKNDFGADKIAVAHNLEDCSETMLFHLFRGSNLKGLGGISPVKDRIIRPLMNVSRIDIEAYLKEKQLEWMEDETNASTDYSRNRIRHNIIPEAELICSGAAVRMAETAEELRLTETYLEKQTGLAYYECCEKTDGGIFVDLKQFGRLHPAIKSRVFYKVLEQNAKETRNLGRIHVQELLKLCDLQPGRCIDLPYRMCAHRTAEGILVRKEPECGEISTEVSLLSRKDLEAGKEIVFEADGLGTVKARLLFNCELKNIPQKTYTKWFNYDKITKCAVFRKRMEGDFLVIDDAGNHKKLKEYFIQEKIPAYKRNDVWILADGNHVMWIPGYRISAFYKITENTEKVLEITIGGNENG